MKTIVIGAGRFQPGSGDQGRSARYGSDGTEDSLVQSKVLEFTIKKYASEEFKIVNTYHLDRPRLRFRNNPTPFSLVRFWVPELAGYEGMACYFDADMIVFDDVAKLFAAAKGNHALWKAGRESVLVYDCARLKHWNVWSFRDRLDSGELNYGQFMPTLAGERNIGNLPEEWNHLGHFTEGKTKLIHYTNLFNQPWRPKSLHSFGHLWWNALGEAVKAGFVTDDDLKTGGLFGDRRISGAPQHI